MMKAISATFTCALLAGCATTYSADGPAPVSNSPFTTVTEGPTLATLTMPPVARTLEDQNVLFWDDAQRSARFRRMESWFAGYEVPAAQKLREFPAGSQLAPALRSRIAALVLETNAAGAMVIQDGKLRYEGYSLGFDASQRWTSFSVAKSFTSTLLGAAIRDGYVTSLEDSVAKYIPEMKGTAYENVTVKQLATMTSGIRWNEDYTDPDSDVAQMASIAAGPGEDAIVNQLKVLPREAPAGEKFVYKTGETNLLGVLVERATGSSLAGYAKVKIVDPAGFEAPMFWMIEPSGRNIGGCCLSLRLADYARMGQFVLDGGGDVVPDGWFAEATAMQVKFGDQYPGLGYGYQWWTYPGGNYGAQGIFGQAITIVPEHDLVVAVVSNWPTATTSDYRGKWQAVIAEIAAAD
jgi:CubicO group peptidase (beta-lactamase class C family)